MSSNKVASECQNKRARCHQGDPKYCNACRRVYCDLCYDAQLVHEDEENRLGEHEKTDLDTASFVLALFGNKDSVEDRERLHLKNIQSKWFGTHIDEQESKSYFHDFGGLISLLQKSPLLPHQQFPSLISFVGDTGTGKSTLINGVLKLPAQIRQRAPEDILSPVMGASYEQDIPTSGDVHLFGDPGTRDTHHPMFYADCEGMGGGELPPAAAACLGRVSKISEFKDLVHKQREMSPRSPPITRGWAVRELYPRILFPFSDVVCYVTRNPRLFEHHLETLLQWANTAIDKTTNQPILPHAFLIINAFAVEDAPEGYFQDWWDVDQVTSHFLSLRQDLIKSTTSVVGKLASDWITLRGRDITSLEDLIRCYYRDFKIICIPEIKSSQHSRITTQYRRLQTAIGTASENSRRSRKDVGFLMSAETLERYLEMAFDHFTATPNLPFNFLSAALTRSPVTQTFKDHICKLAIQYMDVYPHKTGEKLFVEMAPWVASCIFLNSHRFELPNNDSADLMFERYQHFCKEAQTEFYDRSWPCEATDKKGLRCVNIKSTHSAKGHQNREGIIFFANDSRFKLSFRSSYETDTDKKQANEMFSENVHSALRRCIRKYKGLLDQHDPNGTDMRRAVAGIHMSMFVKYIRRRRLVESLISHKTCFCCLASSPAHKLFCGHIICQLCLEDYSEEDKDSYSRILKICPLCGFKGPELRFEMKPPTAGLRILCLDGGGVRSIIQLEILKCLEMVIGLGIPIQNFFDLIIGTSGGGIVAAALGLKRLGVDDCIEMFTDLAGKAFKKRPGIDIPVVGKLIMAHHHGQYKTSGLENVLKDIFGHDPIFGATVDYGVKSNLKVGVTATSSSRQAFLLTNYNRPPLEQKSCKPIGTRDGTEEPGYNPDAEDSNSIKDETAESIIYQESSYEDDLLYENTSSYIRGNRYTEQHDEDHEEIDDRLSKNSKNSEGSSESCIDGVNEAISTRGSYVFFRGESVATELELWEAVRATSAAPGYFKSFSHPASKYTFDDGALRCNNPVFVADKERKILWPQLARQDPDILVSIGTGFDPAPSGSTTDSSVLPKHGISSYIRKMIKLGSAAIQDDMNCELMWQEYIEGMGIGSEPTERSRRYYRLNPVLNSPIPKLDDLDQIPSLQRKAREFIMGGPSIKEVAKSLIGSLFYFELQIVSPDHSSSLFFLNQWGCDLNCTGVIKCRLSSLPLMQRLNNYENHKELPKRNIFLIAEKGGTRHGLSADCRSGNVIGDLISYDVSFSLKYTDKAKEMCIFLSLWGGVEKAVSISGFPRELYAEAKAFSPKQSSGTNSFHSLS